MEFTAKIEDCDVFNINKYLGIKDDVDINCNRPDTEVKYHLEIEAREWGIKWISIVVLKVTTDITWEVYENDLTEEEKEQLIKMGGTLLRNGYIEGELMVNSDLKPNNQAWNIRNDLSFEPDGALSIDNVSFDFEDYIINIS